MLLRKISAIDPVAVLSASSVTLKALLQLPDLVHQCFIINEDIESYQSEVRKILIDQNVPPGYVLIPH